MPSHMDAMSQNKRARQSEDHGNEPMQAWRRITSKILYLIIGIAELTMDLIKPRRISEEEENPYGPAPFNVFGPRVPLQGTLSEAASSWSHVGTEPSRDPEETEIRSPPSVDNYALVREPKILQMVGVPPTCFHNRTCNLYRTLKQGRNRNRLFWRCPLMIQKQCDTFVWSGIQPWWSENPKAQTADFVTPGEKNSPDSTYFDCRPETERTSPSSTYFTPVEECPHVNLTRKGTNGHYLREKCRDCGKIIQHEKKSETATATPATPTYTPTSPGENPPTKSSETDADYREFKEFKEFKRWQERQRKK